MEWMLLLAFGGLWAVGYHAIRRALGATDLWICIGGALPLALMLLLGLGHGLSQVIGQRVAWPLSYLVLGIVLVWFYRERKNLAPLSRVSFSKGQYALIFLFFAAAYFVMHNREVIRPEDDYWIHFPLIAMLSRGNFPPPNPFFYDLTLHGHFGRDYLLAMLSQVCGHNIMVTTWTFNHLLSASSFVLALGLGCRGAGRMGGILMPLFLFFGISVGSRVGMIDTYDNNNLLVYACLLVLFGILMAVPERPKTFFLLAPLLGVYAIIYETHMILFLGCLLGLPLVLAWCDRSSFDKRLFGRCLVAAAASVLLAACLGGPIQDLALRAMGLESAKVTHADTYQSQKVEIHFPKKQFLKILLGPDDYRRRSYVYEGKLFSNLSPTREQEGYEYTFVFHPQVLVMHWMALYLCLPTGLFLLLRRHKLGIVLWAYGMAAYLTPAVVDFGPLHEKEYLRWQYAADFCFAGSLALALALWWRDRPKRSTLIAIVLLSVLVTIGGERKINKSVINLQKSTPDQRAKMLSPLYPSSRRWFLDAEELNLDSATLDLSRELRGLSKPGDRLLTNFNARGHWELFRESTVVGLCGLRSVAHQSPPPWMADGIAPFFRTANWTVFWQTLDPRALSALKVNWILAEGTTQFLDRLSALSPLDEKSRQGGLAIFSVRTETGSSNPTPQELRFNNLQLPPVKELQSEVAFSMFLGIENPSDQPIDWEGMLTVRQTPQSGTDPGGIVEPLKLWAKLNVAPHSVKDIPLWLVPPLVEGTYLVQVLMGEKVIAEKEYSWDLKGQAEAIRILSDDGQAVTIETGGFDVKGPLKLGWRLYDLVEKRYPTPFGFAFTTAWDSAQKRVPYKPLENPERYTADVFLISNSGLEIKLQRAGD